MKRKFFVKVIFGILLTFLLLNFGHCNAAAVNDSPVAKRDAVNSLLENNKVNGVVLFGDLATNPTVVECNQPGMKQNDVITATGLYPIASLQKVYTGIAIQKLIDEGKLSLNTKISQFYPSIPNASKITIENLLTHRSGIKDKTSGPTDLLKNQKAQMKFAQKNLDSTGKTGAWNYSNSDYALLAGIISKVTGQSYEKYLSTNLFKPNSLKNIKFYNQVTNASQITNAKGPGNAQNNHLNFEELKTGMSGELGAGEVFSSAQDYWNFISGLVAGKYVPLNNIISNPYNYYDGVYLGDGIIHADGSINGYQSCFIANYRTNQAFIFFSNNITFGQMLNLREQLSNICL